uniref:NTR domain-containing protein n=1 Tax=Ditylenchus dipsaci TaxID=166011 RepID=A0A915DI90_9BILA
MDRRVLSSLFLVLLSVLLPVVWSCKCKAQPPKVSYCNAHWVAHTHINSRQKEQKMPKGIIDRQIFSNLHYRVKYLNIYKMPEEFNNTALPIDIYSAEEDAACGIILEPGHEYLLTGRLVNGTMLTQLCGQILFDDLQKSKLEDVLEWKEVPETTQNNCKRKHSSQNAKVCWLSCNDD